MIVNLAITHHVPNPTLDPTLLQRLSPSPKAHTPPHIRCTFSTPPRAPRIPPLLLSVTQTPLNTAIAKADTLPYTPANALVP